MRLVSLVLFLWLALCSPAGATTVAWDGKNLAADCQITMNNHERLMIATKLFYSFDRKEWLGVSGDLVDITKVVRWFQNTKEETNDTIFGNFSVLRVTKKGQVYLYKNDLVDKIEVKGQCAVGSGANYALGAMSAGKNARDAVKIASAHDVFTSQMVTSVKVK